MIVAELFTLFGVEMDSSWKKVDSMLSSLAHKAAIFGTAAAYGLERMVMHSVESATHLVSLSRAIGMGIEKTQEWGYVAQQSGSNLKELSMGLNMLLRNMKEYGAGRGGKVMASYFNDLKISRQAALAGGKDQESFDAYLLKLSKNLSGLGETAQATFTKMFGVRAGRAMLADLARGPEVIIELRKHYRTLGAEMSSEDVLSLKGLGNTINDVKLAFEGLINHALVEAAPIIKDLAERFIKFITDVDNRREIMETFKKVIVALGKIAPVVGRGIMLIGKALVWMADHQDVVLGVLAAIVAVKTAVWGITIGKGLLSLIGAFTDLGLAADGAAASAAAAGAAGAAGAGAAGAAGGSAAGKAVLGSEIELGAAGAGVASAGAGVGIGAAAEIGLGAAIKGAMGPALGLYLIDSAITSAFGESPMEKAINRFKAQQSDKRLTLEQQAAANPGGTTITNGDTTIIVHANGANKDVGEAVKESIEEHEANRMRDALDKLGIRGRRQK